MKNPLLAFVFIFISFMTGYAQTGKNDVESAIDVLNRSIISQDSALLEKSTAAELTYGHSTGLVEDKAAFLKDVLSGPTKFHQILSADQTISITGDIALVRNISSIKGIKDGAPLDIKIGMLMVWEKKGSHWILLARQGYKLP